MFNAPLTSSRTDALARAAALAQRAHDLRRMQVDVQKLTAHEVEVLARTAASFFDAIPLPEFTTKLLPHSERGLRRIRHRILHRTINTTATGTLIRALLLGSDGKLRLFSARSVVSRDLLLILEPGRTLPAGVVREVVDWTPMLRVPQFRPFEILEKISRALDAVEDQIADAEQRVSVQWAALASGDLSALLAEGDAARSRSAAEGDAAASRSAAEGPVGPRASVRTRAATDAAPTAAAGPDVAVEPARAADTPAITAAAVGSGRFTDADIPADTVRAVSPPRFAADLTMGAPETAERAPAATLRPADGAHASESAGAPAPVADVNDVFGAVGLFDMFQRVEHVADAAARGYDEPGSSDGPTSPAAAGRGADATPAVYPAPCVDADAPADWIDFEEDLPPSTALRPPDAGVAAAMRALFPVMPAPR